MDALFRDTAGGKAGLEIAQALLGNPHVRQQDIEGGLVEAATLLDLHWRDANAFLVDLGGLARHAARDHAAHISPVGAYRGEKHQLPVLEHRENDRDVVEVSAAGIRVV